MEQRFLGNSGLAVSALTFGTMTIGGRDRFAQMGDLGVDDMIRILDVLRDSGVTTIDTADVYSYGGAEEILGQALEGRRNDFVLVTKAFQPMVPGPLGTGLSRKYLPLGVRSRPATSADRLRRSLSVPRNRTCSCPWTRRCAPTKKSGLVREGPLHRLLQPVGLAGDEGAGRLGPPQTPRYVTQQVDYSLVARDVEHEIVPLAVDEKAA